MSEAEKVILSGVILQRGSVINILIVINAEFLKEIINLYRTIPSKQMLVEEER